jgi:hypothetical protein
MRAPPSSRKAATCKPGPSFSSGYHSPVMATRRIVNLPSVSRPPGLWLELGRTLSYPELAIRTERPQTSTIASKRTWRRVGGAAVA